MVHFNFIDHCFRKLNKNHCLKYLKRKRISKWLLLFEQLERLNFTEKVSRSMKRDSFKISSFPKLDAI